MRRYRVCRLPFGLAAIFVMAVLVLRPQLAIAQHGGGGHAGGGGGHVGGGHFAGFGGSHSRSASSKTSSNSSAKPPAESTPPVIAAGVPIGSAASAKEFAPFSPAPAHTTIGFPPTAPSTTFPTALLRSAGPLSFSGEGHQIWQNFAARSTTAAMPPATILLPPHIARQPIYMVPYYPAYYPPFGYYGFSPFLGFGWGWGCSPFYPWAFGCGGFGYGSSYGYGYDSGGDYPPAWNDSQAPPSDDDTFSSPSPSTWQNAPADEEAQGNVATSIPKTLVYLQDGSSYEVTDYWLVDNKLHYVTNYGGENSVSLSQIDVQRTVDANAARGVNFTLHPAPPASLTPPPSADSAPPAAQQ